MKRRWRVSIAAMIIYCCDLGIIDESRKQYFFREMTRQNIRKEEPLDNDLQIEHKIVSWLRTVTQNLIEQGATTFFLGGYGEFDSLAASILREQKKKYPQIELVLILAYLNTGRNTSGYDSTVYPPLETVPHRFAISHRNRWMVESADVVVAYVLHDWGGAATTLRCAKQKKKQIISYRDEMGS